MRMRPRIDRVLATRTIHPLADDALNLAELDPAIWHVMSRDKVHGPFTPGHLQSFAEAGRIGPLTRISSGDGNPSCRRWITLPCAHVSKPSSKGAARGAPKPQIS